MRYRLLLGSFGLCVALLLAGSATASSPRTVVPDRWLTSPPSATPTPTPIPQLTEIALGVPAGDAYRPSSLAVDATRAMAYVYSTRGPAGDPVLSLIDLARGVVTRVLRLPGATFNNAGQVLLAPDGSRGYLVNPDLKTLRLFDPQTGRLGPQEIKDVQAAALSPDGRRLYVIGESRVAAYETEQLAATALYTLTLWSQNVSRPAALAAGRDGVAIALRGRQDSLALYAAEQGKRLADVSLDGYAEAIASGPAGGWAVRLGYPAPRVQRFDAGLRLLAEAPAPTGSGLFYDAAHRRYVLGGWWPTSGPTAKGGTVLALAEQNLAALAEEPWLEGSPPDVFESYGDQLLALTRSGNAQLSTLAADSLRPVGRTILGVQLLDMALDEDTGTLYVADNHQRIHVVSAGDGRERAIWQGKAPLALDARNGRLYVNSSEGVQALDKQTGQVRASYPQAGAIAADPARDLVYLVDRGVTMYDRLGRPVAPLTSTFPIPQGFSPNPYAVAAWVNPVTGDLAVAMNNGTPGSNNSTYLRLYPPGVDRPITITNNAQWVQDVTFDPAGGDAFVSYGASFKGLEALRRLGRTGAELAALRGRYGALALDDRAGLLYAAAAGAIARVRAADLSLLAVYRAPEQVQQLLLDARGSALRA